MPKVASPTTAQSLGTLLKSARDIMRKDKGVNGDLDRKNPRAKEDITHLPPAQLAASILKKEQRIAEIMDRIQRLLLK